MLLIWVGGPGSVRLSHASIFGEFALLRCLKLYDLNAAKDAELRSNLGKVAVLCEPIRDLRTLSYPGYPTFEDGMPPLFYYYIPGTGWGSKAAQPSDQEDQDFVYMADGSGLNLGCPLRLARALEILDTLTPAVAQECLEGIKTTHKHLPTVEELLWTDCLAYTGPLQRGPVVGPNGKACDWELTCVEETVLLEVKNRAFTWTLQVDGKDFIPRPGSFLGKASKQFPPPSGKLHVVGITGIHYADDNLVNLIAADLNAHPNVDAVLYRMYVGHPVVVTLKEQVRTRLVRCLRPFKNESFQCGANVFFHRESRDGRIESYQLNPKPYAKAIPGVFTHSIEGTTLAIRPLVRGVPRYPYRNQIKWLETGEPVFEVVTPSLPANPSRWGA